jgi:hypothetical protein
MKYTVKAPDGHSVEVEADENATDEQILDLAKAKYTPKVEERRERTAKPEAKPGDDYSGPAWEKFKADMEKAGLSPEDQNRVMAEAMQNAPPPPVWRPNPITTELREKMAQMPPSGVSPSIGQAVAAGAGAAAGYKANPMLDALVQRYQTQPAAHAMTSGEKWSANWAGQERPGVGGVPEASAAYQRGKGQGPVTSEMTKRWGPLSTPPAEPGVFQGSLADRLIAQSRAAELLEAQKASPLYQVQQLFGKIGKTGAAMMQDVLRSKYVGALAGAGTAYEGFNALKNLYEGNVEESALSGLGALGGGISMIPTPPTRFGGAALSSIPYIYRKMREVPVDQSQKAMISVDPMGNPIP